MAEIVYLNGKLVPRTEARVSPFDYGFLYGYGLFETMRAYHGVIFSLERHLKRLLDGAKTIGLGMGLTEEALSKACTDTLDANGLKEARLRLTVSRGEVETFPGTTSKATPTVLVSATNYPGLPASTYKKGYRVTIASYRRCRQSILPGVKSTNYLVNLLARIEAEKAGADEALLMNDAGEITEGTTCNVFFVDSRRGLVTPSLECGLLPGITREVVIEVAGSLGIKVAEAEVRHEDLGQFSEAFLTNSVIEIMPLAEIRESTDKIIKIGSGKPGKLTMRLMAAYRERVERETARS